MSKWADYLISAVRYDRNSTYITNLMVHQDNGDSIGSGFDWTREKIVSYIEKNTTFATIYKRDGKWRRGENVQVIKIDGVKYLRTDSNHTKKDNLGELPEF